MPALTDLILWTGLAALWLIVAYVIALGIGRAAQLGSDDAGERA